MMKAKKNPTTGELISKICRSCVGLSSEVRAQLPVPDFPNYPAGSEGPRAAEELIWGELRGWHTIAATLRRAA